VRSPRSSRECESTDRTQDRHAARASDAFVHPCVLPTVWRRAPKSGL
jgi:hypothetical protein